MMFLGRKVLISTFVLFLFAFLFQSMAFAENIQNGSIGTVTVQILNLRKSPDISSKILTKIKFGEKVKLISNSKDWYKVNYGGVEGWVSGSHIKISKPETKIGKVNVEILKVRKSPSTTAAVIAKLEKGITFQL